jgi:hypothetical protein
VRKQSPSVRVCHRHECGKAIQLHTRICIRASAEICAYRLRVNWRDKSTVPTAVLTQFYSGYGRDLYLKGTRFDFRLGHRMY